MPGELHNIGPFELVQALGQGGAGEVWRARVAGQPLDIAVKLLRRGPWDDQTIARFLDEARATAGLDHPHLVQVLDFGVLEEAGQATPYLAMDLASGGTLVQVAPSLPWEGLSAALLQVLEGLAHAHARGVTHLDIKGDNIVLGLPGDGRTGWRVVDFGIAHALGSQGESRVSGTPAYMSPEQWQAQWWDYGPWTDVYAFGCMVWRLVTGKAPYEGGLVELARQHMVGRRPPLTPTRTVPQDLGAWLDRAMHPDPDQRFQHVADAADAWRALGTAQAPASALPEPRDLAEDSSTFVLEDLDLKTTVRDVPQAPVPMRPAAGAPVQTRALPDDWRAVDRAATPLSMGVLGLGMVAARVPPMVGREALRDILWNALGAAADTGAPQHLCLHGAPGCGKTRLATWLGEVAALGNHGTWLIARHADTPDGHHALAGACARLLRCEGVDRHSEVRELVRRFARQVGAEDDEDRTLLEDLVTAKGPPSSQAIIRCLSLAARRGPLVLILDDVAAAPHTLRLAKGVSGPVLVLATWEGSPDLGPGWQAHQVDPLPDADMRHLIEGLLPMTTRAIARLVDGAAGNPEEAVQRVLHHARRGDFKPSGDRYALAHDAPDPADDLDALWADRLDAALEGFAGSDWLALYVAAAMGFAIQDADWRAALSTPPADNLVRALLEARVLVRAPREQGWRFAHPRVRTVLERRARDAGHWAGANALCARTHQGVDGDRGQLGLHLLEAGDPQGAVPHLLSAAEAAFSGGRSHESAAALARLERAFGALDLPETDSARIEARVIAARVDRQRHGPVGSIPGAEEALRLARVNGDPDLIAKAGRALAMAVRSARDYPRAIQLLEDLLADPGPDIGATQRSRLLAALGISICDITRDQPDQVPRAHAALDQALALGGLSPAQVGDARLYKSRLADDLDLAREQVLEALAAYQRAGTLIGRAISNYDLASICAKQGELDAGLQHFREAARLFDLTGSHAAGTARLGLGMVLCQLERPREARPVFIRVLDRARRIGREQLHLLACCGLVSCNAAEGDWEAIDPLMEQMRPLAQSQQLSAGEAWNHLRAAFEAAQAAGRHDLAQRLTELNTRIEAATTP